MGTPLYRISRRRAVVFSRRRGPPRMFLRLALRSPCAVRPHFTLSASAVSPAAHAGKGKEESDEDTADAPNLLGGAYDSSDDEGGDLRTGLVGTADVTAIIKGSNTPVKTQSSAKVTCASKITDGDGSVEWPPSRRGETLKELAEPDKAKRQVIEKMVGFVVKYGQAFEDKARPR